MWNVGSNQTKNKLRLLSIKQNASRAVKFGLSILLLCLVWDARLLVADETPQNIDEDAPAETAPEESPPTAEPEPSTPATDAEPDLDALPEIEARILQLKPVKMSTSKRVFLFETSQQDISIPPERKLLLIKDGDENIMALRVLRSMPAQNQIIAKRIRKYEGHEELILGDSLLAVEKLSDRVSPPPSEEDKADMEEVEPEPLPFDPDLDAGSSPNPDGQDSNRSTNSLEEDNKDELGLSVEENHVQFEKHKYWLTAGAALLSNTPNGGSLNSGGYYYAGAGVRYGVTVAERLWNKNPSHLDSLTLEGGLYFYQILGLDEASDGTSGSYSVVPLLVTGRYNYFFTEDFVGFLYAGFIKNTVMSSNNSTEERVNNLSRLAPALGIGATYRIGPQWYARTDVGIDTLGLSLMLRF